MLGCTSPKFPRAISTNVGPHGNSGPIVWDDFPVTVTVYDAGSLAELCKGVFRGGGVAVIRGAGKSFSISLGR